MAWYLGWCCHKSVLRISYTARHVALEAKLINQNAVCFRSETKFIDKLLDLILFYSVDDFYNAVNTAKAKIKIKGFHRFHFFSFTPIVHDVPPIPKLWPRHWLQPISRSSSSCIRPRYAQFLSYNAKFRHRHTMIRYTP